MRGVKIFDRAINVIASEYFKKRGNSHELHQFSSLFNSNYLSNLADLFLKIDKKIQMVFIRIIMKLIWGGLIKNH